ncbi:PAS domain-containing sensor histidine kinase [uncultured Pontibacter sp.]|uniref:PAS domain-containing sensor histidine kinase n=1 Tax=uncultured Pontibacter sp. TaxID=453356 RepID=UPI0026206398|nr:PAS domain-containing sensor histidine kinase [uncultured Pontibacter sp.]
MNTEPDVFLTVDGISLPNDYYRLLVQNITDYAVFLLDATGHVATWNTGAELIKQYTAEDIVGKHFSVFYTQEDKDRDYPATELKEAVKHGRYEDEGWRVKKDGSVFWANVIITPVFGDNHELLGFTKVTKNLSERKKAEDDLYKAYEGLKESEERFRLLIQGVTDYAIFMLDPAGNVASWNEGAKKLKGYEAKEIIGKFFAKFYSREAIKQGYPEYELEQAKANGSFEDEGWRYRKDGSAFWANTVLTAIYNPKNELVGYSKITRDLTEKKKLERQLFQMNEELKESEEKSRLLIDSVKDYAILMLNPDGIIMSWNTGAERIKGYTPNEIIGKHFSIFYNREAIESGFPQFELKRAIANGQFEDEGWRIRKDGTAFWANVVISPIYNLEKRLLGFAKITRDLTERRRNEELMRRNMELVRINNELDNFVYTASHDLKSPITNLEGLLTALEEDLGEDSAKHRELLKMMGGAVTVLKNVIADLADVTKLQHNVQQAEKVSIAAIIEEVKESLRDIIATSKTEIKADVSGFETLNYPRKNLRSILYNLISNAIKYSDPLRAPEVSIRTTITDTGEYLVTVSDNGLGIAEQHKNKVFSMFKRVHDHVEGSGVGLYLVKKILDNSGDRIELESELGKGSDFNVYFKQ